VIPLRPGRKEPLISDWPNKATTDEAQIRKWWSRWRDANIGIATGRFLDGYFCVIDFDPRNGGGWFDDVGEEVLPPTWVVHSGRGGRHFYYRTPELLRNTKLDAGVDLKGEGGYVVVPPSILLDANGQQIGEYGWQVGSAPKDLEMAEVPIWILSKQGGEGAKGSVGQTAGRALSLWLMPPPIPKGMRHDFLVSFGGALHGAGLSEREIEAGLWGAIELFETREDFDPVAEIRGILRSLPKWEGATYTIGSLLRMLPKKTAEVVRRALMVGGGASEPVANDGKSSNRCDAEDVFQRQVADDPQSDVLSAPHSGGAMGGEQSGGAMGGEGGGTPKVLQTDMEDSRRRGLRLLAAEIVSKLEVRQKEDGTFRYVYRAADGTELEAACTPRGVKELLERLGVKATLKEVEGILGVIQPDRGEETKERRGRKSKPVDIENIKAILGRYKWVRWQGDLWQVTKPTIYRADLDRIHGVLKQNGLEVGKDTLRSYWTEIMASLPKSRLLGLVVTPEPTYGVVGGLRGLWFCHRETLYFVTPYEIRIFPAGQWPEGVYALDTGEEGVLPDWDGTPEHTLGYWEGITTRMAEDKKIPQDKLQRVTLAMFLPVLFGQGHIGLILHGAARSGKSTLLKAMAYLRYGRKPKTPNGQNLRDLTAVLQRRQMVFFDEVNTFTSELQEVLKRMITHDTTEMRALYTNLDTVEADLAGSAIFCTTNLGKLASDLRTRCFVWHLEEKEGSLYEQDILDFCEVLWRPALGGAIKLYQMAACLKRPPQTLLPEIRFRDWLAWAYRYAIVLGVEKEFVVFVKKAKSAAHSGDKYGFILDLLNEGKIEPNKEYTATDLLELAGTDEAKGLRYALKSEAVRANLIAMVRDIGYNLCLEKVRMKGDKKDKYRFVFTPLHALTGSHRLRQILQRLGVAAKIGEDDDESLLPPESTPLTLPQLDNPPPENTTGGAVPQNEIKTLTDMETEKKQSPRHPVAGERTKPNSGRHPSRPSKTDPKKTPPSSEWAYRAGAVPQNKDGWVSEGLFVPPQDTKPTTVSQSPSEVSLKNTTQDEEYPNDLEIIEYIDEQLKAQAERRLPLETSLEWLRGFMLLHELKIWELGLKKAYFYIVYREVELQKAIDALRYDELTPEKDPRYLIYANNEMGRS